MSNLHLKSGFKLSALALSIGLSLMSTHGFALEALDDDSMAETTGEGIAVLPTDFSVRFNQGVESGTGSVDTGYVRIIPVGPLTDAAVTAGASKGEVYLYGAAISRADTNVNSRFSGTNIASWGSVVNPWVIKTVTENVRNFAGNEEALSYLSVETPLYNSAGFADASQNDYHLKLGMWTDVFMRDRSTAVTETDPTTWGNGLSNRLRLQVIANDFSINGSHLNIFQTLGGAVTVTDGMSSSYNNTLGIAGKLRFNSGDGQTLRATTSFTAGSRTVQAYTQTWNGNTFRNVAGPDNYTDTSGISGGAASAGCNAGTSTHRAAGSSCLFQFQTRAVTDTASSSTWTAPSLNSVFRLSTRETTDTGLLATPAINGGNAPTFDPTEGLFIYNLNVNLVLGQLYQPLVVGVAPDNRNVVFELSRIANKESIYKQIYTNYADSNPLTNGGYSGSTCNVNFCGSNSTATYQGTNATHSSITMGSTEYNATTNITTAHKGAGAVGISFGALPTGVQTYSTPAQSYRDVQVRTRGTTQACCFGLGAWSFDPYGGYSNLAVGSSARYNLATFSPNTWTQQTPLAQPAFATPTSSVPINNLGSAVIDGILIQHMKITTKGL